MESLYEALDAKTLHVICNSMFKPLIVFLDEFLADLRENNEVFKAVAAITAIAIICTAIMFVVPPPTT
jgi:hypothetical protein